MLQVLTVLVRVIIKLMKKVNLHQTMKLLPYNLEFANQSKIICEPNFFDSVHNFLKTRNSRN